MCVQPVTNANSISSTDVSIFDKRGNLITVCPGLLIPDWLRIRIITMC